MATNTVNIPEGFVLREQKQQGGQNIPEGFVLRKQPQRGGITSQQVVGSGFEQPQDTIQGLLSQLGSTLPDPGEPKQIEQPLPLLGQEFAAANVAKEQQRQKKLQVVQELQLRGLSLKDIEERLDPTFAQQLKQDIGRTGGGIAGGIAGAKAGAVAGSAVAPGIGTAIGALLGAAMGAGLGGFVGEDVQNTVEMVNIANKAKRGEKLTFKDRNLISRTEEELKAERRGAALGEGVSELVGRVGIGTIAKVSRRPFINAVVPEVLEFQDDFARAGGKFSPGELVDSSAAKSNISAFAADAVDVFESIGEKGFGGQGIFKRFRAQKQKIPFRKTIQNVADSIVGTAKRMNPEQKGVLLNNILSNRKTAYKGVRNSLYRWTRKANNGNDILVSIDPLEKFLANERRALTGKLGRTDVGDRLVQTLDDIIAEVKTRGRVRDPLGSGKFVSGKQMQILEVEDMLVGLNSELRALENAGDTQGKRIATIAKKIMTQEAKRAEKGLEPEAFRRLGVAKKFVREGQPIFEEQFVKKLLKGDTGLEKNPEILNSILFPNNKPSQIKRARDLILGPKGFGGKVEPDKLRAWNNFTLGWLEDAIKGSVDPKTDVFRAGIFSSKLKALVAKTGDATSTNQSLDIMFGKKISRQLQRVPELSGILTGATEGGGSLAIRLGQIGAIAGIAGGGALKSPGIALTSTGLLLAPTAIALLFTSDIGIKALSVGLKAKPGSKAAAAAAVRLTAIVRRLNEKYDRQYAINFNGLERK